MLIVVEGIHGCGKSTLINSLVKKLQIDGREVVTTSWNSYDLVHPAIYYLRKNGLLYNPYLYFMMHLSDFSFRHEQEILPALQSGKVVIADRYVYTGIVRGLVRGLPRSFVEEAYRFAAKPDLTILLDLSAEESLKRTSPRANSTWYIGFGQPHASEDTLDKDEYASYLNVSRNKYLEFARTDLIINGNLTADKIVERVYQEMIKEKLYANQN
ncbi:thymidylate kinase [Fictibacillus nanhaiensis]|uniref:Thymidylate kinase n=1 Tax=Fictibacillus nanhaiensis TaxID=742169 RepID=A0ABS2ZMF7_9BACL|nr:thymidylate kinase [Fictibacillus nanhaiensis]